MKNNREISQISLPEWQRRQCWDEEVRMQSSFYEDEHGARVAWYAYDAEGRRALKYASERAAGSSLSVVELCDPVYYVSPLVTLTRTGYSKHYFEGGRRICTVIGGGFAHVNWDSITSDPMPLVGPHREQLAKVLDAGAESTFEDCIEVQAELGYTDGLYKMMQNESERYVSHEPAFYYHTDHLGSTSRFTDDSGKVVQTLAYMPYGEDWVDDSKFIYSDTNHIGIYQFNGKERDFESGFYYYGARYHWPELWTGWTTPDPLMDKYPGISPYNYCTWNPVIFVDPDGRKLRYAPGVSKEFKEQFKMTVQYMNSQGTAGILSALENLDEIIYINERYDKPSGFDYTNLTINWNPFGGVVTDKGVTLSPATVLNHEADHALQEIINPVQKKIDRTTYDKDYGNKEEKRVITGSEQTTARKHGEIKANEVTRESHKNATSYETVSPISTEGKYEKVIRANQ